MSPLLIIAILLILVFGGLGFLAKVLWWGLVVGVILLVASLITGRRTL